MNNATSHQTVLSSRAKNLLLPNKPIKDKIAEAMKVHYSSVQRWVLVCDSEITPLTQPDSMRVIREETGLTDGLILNTINVAA